MRAGVFVLFSMMLAAAAAAAKPAAPRQPAPQAADPPRSESAGAGSAAEPSGDEPVEDPDAEPGLTALPHVTGPARLDLGNHVTLALPAGMIAFEREVAQRELESHGDDASGVVAVVTTETATWSVVIGYADVGYVDDSDADQLDAGELLESYRQGTLRQNARRRELGVPELFVDRWLEEPHYDRAAHYLAWGLEAHDSDGRVVNAFTRVLGRAGYVSMNLIDEPERVAASRREAAPLLTALQFSPGWTYADHRDGDRSSGLGLRTLVLGTTGVAIASKIGLLAKILLVLKKIVLFVVAGVAGLFRWLSRRKKKAAAAPAPECSGDAPPDPGG